MNRSWNLSVSSVQFTCSVVSYSATPWIAACQASLSITSPGAYSNSCPSGRWCHPAISSSVVPFSSCPQSLPASVFSNESTLSMRWPKYWSFMEFHHSFQRTPRTDLLQNGLIESPCNPGDSQESSPPGYMKPVGHYKFINIDIMGVHEGEERKEK